MIDQDHNEYNDNCNGNRGGCNENYVHDFLPSLAKSDNPIQ